MFSRSYIICLFIFCLVIPFVIIVYSYGKLLCAIRQVSGINKGMGRTRDQRILVMVVVMVICFLLCWLLYTTVACIATFGKPGLITPAASIIPSILAKSSTVYNSIIYVFLNKQVLLGASEMQESNRELQQQVLIQVLPRAAVGAGRRWPRGSCLGQAALRREPGPRRERAPTSRRDPNS